jgi:Fic family protein
MHYSQNIIVFHGRTAPELGKIVGYGALISRYELAIPVPEKLCLISEKNKKYATAEWEVFTPRHAPNDTVYGHLTFALKYEGVNLGLLKKLFQKVDKAEITEIVKSEPTGSYSRMIWFLYEWLMDELLDIPDLKVGNFVNLLNAELQYTGTEIISKRHRIRNNLLGTRDFCPLIRKTAKLEAIIAKNLAQKCTQSLNQFHKDLLVRASAFLLLKDSKASFAIEGEKPLHSRAQRWGKAIGQAGMNQLLTDEILRLQQIVIENARFIEMGWRKEGGFVGEHDRWSNEPIPDHLSAKWQDIDTLMNGLIATNQKIEKSELDPVLAAAIVAFGFVFIHPLVDGNGRLHRYLMHHVLARMNFAQKGIVFPVSSAILSRIDDYRRVLEAYSAPLLEFIQWKVTAKNNVEITNETIDYYRYFDATRQAEFLYECVEQTITDIIPQEVDYLQKYDAMKRFLDNSFEMPDKTVALLIHFLEQNNGKLSKRAITGEFESLTEKEIEEIENEYNRLNS